MTILKIDSSITGDNSVSRQLTAAVTEQLLKASNAPVVQRDLVATPLSHLTLGGSDQDVLELAGTRMRFQLRE